MRSFQPETNAIDDPLHFCNTGSAQASAQQILIVGNIVIGY